MNLRTFVNAATLGKPRLLIPMTAWTTLEYALRGVPYGILLMMVWKLFIPLQSPGTPLDIKGMVWLWVLLTLAMILLFCVSRISYRYVYFGSYDICCRGRLEIADHLRKLPMGYFNANDPGAIGAHLINDYTGVETILAHLLPQLAGAVAMPTVLLLFLAFKNWQMALISALVIPLSLPMVFISQKIIRHFGNKHIHKKVESSSRILEYVQGMRLIKAYSLSGAKFSRLTNVLADLRKLSIRLEAGAGPTVIFSSFILHSGVTLITLFGLTFLFAGTLSLPVYIMFLIIGSRVYEPLLQVMIFLGELTYYRVSVERLEELRNTPELTGADPNIKAFGYDISLSDVGFSYHSKPILRGVSADFKERSMVAIVGPSGSGKTTLTRLITRFWDVDQGSIKIDGKNITQYDPEYLLSLFSVVFQDVYLFNDTIASNILVGRPDAGSDEVIRAAQKARCSEFIDALPDGYKTLVGEGGSTLSGGEKQRISIARAILKDAPIVLLDEATAALDPQNEYLIQQAIEELIESKTVIIIAHRLNTVVNADTIIYLDQGRIIEQGTHEQLLAQAGRYKKMWDEQQRIREWKFPTEEKISCE